jgi:hypothetical protein
MAQTFLMLVLEYQLPRKRQAQNSQACSFNEAPEHLIEAAKLPVPGNGAEVPRLDDWGQLGQNSVRVNPQISRESLSENRPAVSPHRV